jgi:hypothetical protein
MHRGSLHAVFETSGDHRRPTKSRVDAAFSRNSKVRTKTKNQTNPFQSSFIAMPTFEKPGKIALSVYK